MLQYARSDTHFLLFIYDHLRLALIDRATSSSSANVAFTLPSTVSASTDPSHALINRVLASSAKTCLRVYTKEPYDAVSGSGPNGWDGLAKNWNKPSMMATGSENVQRMVYRAVHEWRDRVAREEDESTQYVIPNRYLFKIAEAPPQDVVVLLRMVGDQQYQQPQQPQQQQQQQQQQVSDVVKRRGKELIKVMKHVVKMSDKLEQGQERRVVSSVSASASASTNRQQQRPVSLALPPAHDLNSSLFANENNSAAISLFARKSRLFGNITFGKNKNKNKDVSRIRRVKMKMSGGVLPKVSVRLFFFSLASFQS